HGVELFERQWLVNLILCGNYARLRDAALDELGQSLPGTTLQVACVYGDLSVELGRRAASGRGTLDIVDVLPIQLRNLRKKLPHDAPTRLLMMDSTQLRLPDRSYDRALLFFLLHEQPAEVREQTLREMFRVLKPGGKLVIVDYACPRRWHPLRYLWRPLLAALEPFALDLGGVRLPPCCAARGRFATCTRRHFSGASIRRWWRRALEMDRPDPGERRRAWRGHIARLEHVPAKVTALTREPARERRD